MNDVARKVSEPEPEAIVSALRDAGWLLEQETQTALANFGHNVFPGAAFPDPDDPSKSRETDVATYKQILRDEEQKVTVGLRVLVECKQSSMPYVVVGRPPSRIENSRFRSEHTFRFEQVEVERESKVSPTRFATRKVNASRYLGLENLSMGPWSDPFLGNQMTRLDLKSGKWSASNDGIFTSLIYPLAKAVTHYSNEVGNASQNDPHDPRYRWAHIEFRFPVVVTSADIYQLDVSSPDLQPVKVGWTVVARQIMSQHIDGFFRVDVVNSDCLTSYLSDRIGAFEAAVRTIPISRFVTRVDHEWGALNLPSE